MNQIKTSAFLLALLLSGGAVSATVPEGGVYLNKDGTPITEEVQQPPRLLSNPMPAMSPSVLNAMALLPHSSASSVQFMVDEYGTPTDLSIRESSGSIVLDEYAVQSVQGWKFKAAKQGGRNVSAAVSVPVRFTSMMVSVPAEVSSRPMKEIPKKVQNILDKNGRSADVPVVAAIGSDGKQESAPKAADWPNAKLSADEQRVLQKYATDCVEDWTFTPAQNPDGEKIRSDVLLTVSVH